MPDPSTVEAGVGGTQTSAGLVSAPGGRSRRAALRIASVLAGSGLVVLSAGFALQTLTSQVVNKHAALVKFTPEHISLDASEGRERALLSVDANIAAPEASEHGIGMRNGICDLRTGDGVSLLRMHLAGASLEDLSQTHLDLELEHGSFTEAMREIRRAGQDASLDCSMGVDLDLYRSGWVFPARHSVRIPMGNILGAAASGMRAGFVRGDTRYVLPTMHDLTAAADADYSMEFSLPSHTVEGLLRHIQDVPVKVKAGITMAEQDIGALEARLGIDGLLQHRTEGSGTGARTVFVLPARVAGQADVAAATAVLSAAATGEEAEFKANHVFHVRPNINGAPVAHEITLVATSPRCAMARAFGTRHSVSLRPDDRPGAPTLMDSVVQGRKLLERKLSGATLEGYGVRLHLRLFFDDTFGGRFDVDAKGGDAANPAMQVNAAVLLKMGSMSDRSRNDTSRTTGILVHDWEYDDVAVAVTARMSLDMNTMDSSGELTEKLIMDKTKSNSNGGEEKSGWNGPVWEHKVESIRGTAGFSYDASQMLGKVNVLVDISSTELMYIGARGINNYTWSEKSNNPTKTNSYDPFALTGRARRLYDAVSQTAVGAAVRHVADTARQLTTNPSRFEESSSREYLVGFNASVDFDGTGINGNAFDVDVSLNALDMIIAKVDVEVTETTTDIYRAVASADIQAKEMEEVKLGDQLAPTVLNGGQKQFPNFYGFHENMKIDMRMTASSTVTVDLTTAGKLKVDGNVAVTPACNVKSDDSSKLQTLLGLNITVAANNPMCMSCTGGSNSGDPWWAMGDTLHSQCGNSKDAGWRGSSWEPAKSCCDSTFMSKNMTMGSEWSDSFSLDVNRPTDMTDLWGWLNNDLDIPEVTGGMPTRIDSTYTTAGAVTHRTFLLTADTGDNYRLSIAEQANSKGGRFFDIALMVNGTKEMNATLDTEDQNNVLGFLLKQESPSDAKSKMEVNVRFDQGASGQHNYALSGYMKSGENLTQVFQGSGTASQVGDQIRASGEAFLEDSKKLGSATLDLNNPAGLPVSLNAELKDEKNSEVVKAVINIAEETDRVTLTGTLDLNSSRTGSVDASAQRTNNGNQYAANVNVKDKDDKVLGAVSASFAKATGAVDASLTVNSTEEASMTGMMPEQGSFFAGDMNITVQDDSQIVWFNVSDGFIPSAPKKGLSGFKRMHFIFGTLIEKTFNVNVSTYLEEPPFGGGISGCGVAADLMEPLPYEGSQRDVVRASVDVDFPFDMTGTTAGGQAMNVVTEVVQKVEAEIVMTDVSTFDQQKYKQQLATASGLNADEVEIERIDFKVEVSYSFTSVVTEAEAKTAVATANNVSEDRVEVSVTAARRLFDEPGSAARRLQAVDVKATIVTDDAAAVDTLKASAQDMSALGTALQQTANKVVQGTVKAAPVGKVSLVTKLKTATAPTITAAEMQNIGSAVGGTMQVTSIQAATEMRTAPPTPAPSGTLGTPSTGSASAAAPQSTTCGMWFLGALFAVLFTA